ncbi:autotransporter assembly complex protein TamA [Stakelama sp. CBK3Z-3]|uniref:Autotransporter assembly complex protein TamA n=2 Tax=Stakelama flava TaxID=2860338 RepID=A0ABS6XQL0_9SPHN|nr:autotransporter assembly complex family protein [Stakelama flava]MBW4331696.1 autotransporter assembly complex protein TamA [Stakelama flava]
MYRPVPRRAGTAGAGILLLFQPIAAHGQTASQSAAASQDRSLDPTSPLDAMPDLGVEWPDLSQEAPEPVATGPRMTGAETRYSYRIDGLDDVEADRIRERFESLSALAQHHGDPASPAQLDRRAGQDADLLKELLRAAGYYDADVVVEVDQQQAEPAVVLHVDPRRRYTFGQVQLAGIADTGSHEDDLRKAFGLNAGDPVDADRIDAATTALRERIHDTGFPFAKVSDPQLTVDHSSGTATLALNISPGGNRAFGKIITPDNGVFGADHVQAIARFDPGDVYDEEKVDDLRRAIIQTGLVSSVRITPVEGESSDQVDLNVAMEPAPPRTIAGELGYGTGEGARAEASWTHRNLFPPEGALTLRGVLGTREQLANVIFTRHNVAGRDRVLTAQVAATHVDRDAYEARTLQISGSLERQTNIFFQKKWTWSLGAELLASNERDVIVSTGEPRERTYFIAALPGTLTYDGSDDLLNPTRGFRLGGRISPELSLSGSAFGYTRVQFDASAYQPLSDRLVLAERTRLGTIVGAPRDAVAPSRRFYAGGGASVRGYGYQDIGPRDPNNDPIGGRSLAEFSIEARVRVFGNFGVVPFLDAGNIYTDVIPTLSNLRFGTGLGVRYYSSFGPIRVDVGTPLNPQSGDPRIAVYVSLGQAF